jgi:Fur family ferric uptake transcriptional regulator
MGLPEVREINNLIPDVQEKLKARGFKLTSRREQVLRVLLENRDKHLSAEEVYYLAKQKMPDVGLATVYRTLELCLFSDIICSNDFGDGRRRYEFCGLGSNGHYHHHLICTRCGKIIEDDGDFLDSLERRIYKEHKFRVENHQLKVFGICEKCRLQIKKSDRINSDLSFMNCT